MKQAATLLEFAALAHAFCAWCEAETPDSAREMQAAVWLAKLHAAALELPKTQIANDEGVPAIPSAQLASAQRNLSGFFGGYYRTVFDPDPDSTAEPVMGDVGDDLLDTYKDIKAGALLFQKGRAEEALWHWSFTHRTHWGRHALGALWAMHAQDGGRGR